MPRDSTPKTHGGGPFPFFLPLSSPPAPFLPPTPSKIQFGTPISFTSSSVTPAGLFKPRGPSAPETDEASESVPERREVWNGEGVEVEGVEGETEGVIEKA